MNLPMFVDGALAVCWIPYVLQYLAVWNDMTSSHFRMLLGIDLKA